MRLCGAGNSGVAVQLVDLVIWLVRTGLDSAKVIVRSLLCWLGWQMENSNLWASASTDALLDAPVVRGLRRDRRLGKAFLRAVAQAMAEGAWSRTPGRIGWAISRFRKCQNLVVEGAAVRSQEAKELFLYREHSQTVMSALKEPIISFVCDGTRMGQRDYLFSAAYAPTQKLAFWCSPQVCLEIK